MAQTWLPGDTRQRIQDLIKNSSITQAELAGIIGLSESALSRYLKGQTEMLGDGYIIKIAKHFNVSTDFLLGETDIPDRKNYDIEELGLSAESAKLLYTGKIDSGILNLLLENPKFAHLIRLLALYKDETMLAGIRAANQNYTFLRSLLMGQARFHPEDAATATDLAQKNRITAYQLRRVSFLRVLDSYIFHWKTLLSFFKNSKTTSCLKYPSFTSG